MWKRLIFAIFACLSWVAAVVRQVVVAVGDADGRVAAVAAVVGEDEGGDPGQVGLERQGQQVDHQPDMLARSRPDMPSGRGELPGRGRDLGAARRDPLLDLADAGQVLVQLAAVGRRRGLAEPAGVLADEVEDALVVLSRRGLRPRVDSPSPWDAEEPIEDQARIDLLGDRRRLATPGEVGLIGAAVAGVADSRLPGRPRSRSPARGSGSGADFRAAIWSTEIPAGCRPRRSCWRGGR